MYKDKDLIIWPNPILIVPTFQVIKFDDNLEALVKNMQWVMKKYKGIGLAAPQIGVRESVFIYNYDGSQGTMINPVYTPIKDSPIEELGEGCLSFPGVTVKVKRPLKIHMKWQDLLGREEESDFEGFVSLVIHHENDHLNGTTIATYLSTLKRDFVTRKMKRIQKRRKQYLQTMKGKLK